MTRNFNRFIRWGGACFKLLLVVYLAGSLPVQAATSYKYVIIDSVHSSLLATDIDPASGMDHSLVDGGTFGAFFSNDTQVDYFIPTLVTDSGALNITDNKLTIKNGSDFVFNGNAAAARITLNNYNYSSQAVDTSAFYLNLQNNKLDLLGGLKESTGSLYGALFEGNNSAVGNSAVDSNELNLTANGFSEAATPNLVGGAIKIEMTNRTFDTDGNISNNKVTIEALPDDPVKSDIFGGQFLTTTSGFYDSSATYAVNSNVIGNKVILKNGTFNGTVTAGDATLSNTTNTALYGSLNGTVSSNMITIDGGTYDGSVLIGGRAALEGTERGFEANSSITLNNNKILINGGTFQDALIIGAAATYEYTNQIMNGAMSNNKIEILGTPDLTGATLIGAYSNNANTKSGNTLSVLSKGLTAFGVDGFDTYQFNVSDAVSGDTYLTVTNGNGHNNDFFTNYEKSVQNSAIDLTGVNFSWSDISSRPTGLELGKSVTLLKETSSLGLTGTIANQGEQTNLTEGSVTYSYKVIQNGNAVNLLHNGINTSGDFSGAVNLSAPDYAGGDLFLQVGGTLTAPSITVANSSQATASLTVGTLDVTAQDTTLSLDGTSPDQIQFDTIDVQNGQAFTKSGSGFYSFNTLNIDGSATQFSGLDAMNAANTVNLTGGAAPNFGTINLGNGSTLTVNGGSYDFNTLNVYGKDATLPGDLNANGKQLNFYLSDSTAANDTALNVTGAADISASQIKVGITGGDSPLDKGEQVVLVDAASGLSGEPASQKGVGMHGLLLTYDFDLSVAGNQLLATVTKAGLSEESKAFLEGRAAALSAVSDGADFAAEQAMQSAASAATAREDKSLALFTAFGGGKSRYKTGSHVDVTGFNAAVGLSHAVSIFKADFILASFLEYGTGSYDSHNSFESGSLKGSGDTDFWGLGVLIRYFAPYNTYMDVSLRGGQVSTDFKGNVFFADQAATYDYRSWYYGGHFGLGYLLQASDDFHLDLYARYLLTGQQGKNVTISSGDKIHFSESFSSRVRTGLKMNFFTTDALRPYVGAALDYEFDGKANATAYHMRWDAPSLEGASGVGEAGLSWVRGDWTFGIGAEGYVGQRQGIRGNVQVGYQF